VPNAQLAAAPDLARSLSVPEAAMRMTLKRVHRMGRVLEVAPDQFFLSETVAEMVGRPVAFAASVFFWPAFLASFAASSTLFVYRERDYAACMGPRGYLVTPWRPAPGDQVAKRPFDDRMSP
jgi:hypothetical protein